MRCYWNNTALLLWVHICAPKTVFVFHSLYCQQHTSVYTYIALLLLCWCGVIFFNSEMDAFNTAMEHFNRILKSVWNCFTVSFCISFTKISSNFSGFLMNSLFWIAIESVHLIWFLNEFNCFSHILKLSFSNLDTLEWAKTDFFTNPHNIASNIELK